MFPTEQAEHGIESIERFRHVQPTTASTADVVGTRVGLVAKSEPVVVWARRLFICPDMLEVR